MALRLTDRLVHRETYGMGADGDVSSGLQKKIRLKLRTPSR